MNPASSRRRFLRYGGTTFAIGLAGCVGGGEPSPSETATPTGTETSTTEPQTSGYPDVDERVDELPPGSPALSPSGAWPTYRFDASNTGANPSGTGLRDGTEYWRLNAGGTPAVADGTLYNVFSRDQNPRELTFRDPATAAVETRRSLVSYGVNGTSVVADQRVFVNTFIEVFCFDAKSGAQLWRGPEMDGIQGSPTVHDGTVFVNSGGFDDVSPHLRAFDAASGRERWRYDVGEETKSTPAVGGELVFVTGTGGVYAIDRETGDEAFVLPDVSARWGSPVVDDGVVYANNRGGDMHERVAIDVESQSILWRHVTETDSPPVVDGGIVYIQGQRRIVGLDREDGTVVSSGSRAARPMGLVGDVLYAAGNGTVYAFDVSNDLEVLWSLRTEVVQISDTIGRRVYGVTPVDGAVYVSARDAFYGIGPQERS